MMWNLVNSLYKTLLGKKRYLISWIIHCLQNHQATLWKYWEKNDNISKTFSNTKHKGDPSPSCVFDNKKNVNNSWTGLFLPNTDKHRFQKIKKANMMFYMTFTFCMQITQTNAETEPFKSIRTAVELFLKISL